MKAPNYGIDAPGLVCIMFGVGIGAAVGLIICLILGTGWWATPLALVMVYTLGLGNLMIFYSKFIKIKDRERLLDKHQWSGKETVLDIGCGRGLLVVGAARRLPMGRAIGIDLWIEADQSGNRPDAAEENARLEGVAERVEVRTADMRNLPFPDATFDVIVSHWAVHNLPDASDRRLAISEMRRVLKAGGKLLLADIALQEEYKKELMRTNWKSVVRFGDSPLTAALAIVSFGSFRPIAVFAIKP